MEQTAEHPAWLVKQKAIALRKLPQTPEREEALRSAVAYLNSHKIELLFCPSERPGEEGGQQYKGAGIKQMEFVAAAEAGHKRLAVGGANRSGKTQVVGGCFCKYLRDTAVDRDIFWIIAQDWDMMREVPQKFMWRFLPKEMFPKETVWTTKLGFGMQSAMELTLPSIDEDGRMDFDNPRGTCEIKFKNEKMELNKFESEPVRGIWYTEAKREAVYDACLTRLTDKDGFIWIDYLPKWGWLKYRVRKNAAYKFWQLGMKDNAHNLPDGAIEKKLDDLRGQDNEIKVRVFGQEASAFGAVYPQFDPTKHTCKRFALTPEMKKHLYRCYDYGFRNPSACLWACLLPMGFQWPENTGCVWDGKKLDREVILCYREYYATGQTLPAQAAEIIARSGNKRRKAIYSQVGQEFYEEVNVGESYRMDMVSDPSIFNVDQTGELEAKSRAQRLRECGLACKAGKRANGPNGHTLVSKVRYWFEEDKIIFFEDCENAIREHESWRHKENADGDAAGNEPYEDKDNHTCDAWKELIAEELTTYQPPLMVVDAQEDF